MKKAKYWDLILSLFVVLFLIWDYFIISNTSNAANIRDDGLWALYVLLISIYLVMLISILFKRGKKINSIIDYITGSLVSFIFIVLSLYGIAYLSNTLPLDRYEDYVLHTIPAFIIQLILIIVVLYFRFIDMNRKANVSVQMGFVRYLISRLTIWLFTYGIILVIYFALSDMIYFEVGGV